MIWVTPANSAAPLGGEHPADIEQNGPVFTSLSDSGNELPPPRAEAWTRFDLLRIEMHDRIDCIDCIDCIEHDAARWIVKHKDRCDAALVERRELGGNMTCQIDYWRNTSAQIDHPERASGIIGTAEVGVMCSMNSRTLSNATA